MSIRETAGNIGRNLSNGARKILTPSKKALPLPKRTFMGETPEDYGKRLMERRARKY